jgi:hypothetical protein
MKQYLPNINDAEEGFKIALTFGIATWQLLQLRA